MPSMKDARDAVGLALTAGLPDDIVVVPFGRQADQPDERRVTFVPLRVSPPDVACPSRQYVVQLNVVTPYIEPGPADDDLDDLLELVLSVLDDNGWHWDPADRGTWLDAHHAYAVDVTVLL